MIRFAIRFNAHFRTLLLLLGFGFSLPAAAQPCFTFLGDSVGCAPFQVRIRSCVVNSPNLCYYFFWRPDSPGSDCKTVPVSISDTGFVYQNPGTYIIRQYLGGTNFMDRTVKVFSASALPSFTWTTCKDSLFIQFKDTVFSVFKFDPGDGLGEKTINGGNILYKYKYTFPGQEKSYPIRITGHIPSTCSKLPVLDTITLYKTYVPPLADSLIGIDTLTYRTSIQTRADEPFIYEYFTGGNWTVIKTGITSHAEVQHSDLLSIPDLNKKDTVRVSAINGCGEKLSAPEWMVLWPRTRSDNQKITLTWPSFNLPYLADFLLLRNGVAIASLYNKPDTMYVDSSQLVCGQTYCYQFYIRQKKGAYIGAMVYKSAPICAQATSNVPASPISPVNASVAEKGILISAKASPIAQTYTLFRREREDGAYTKLLETSHLPIIDSTADFNNRAYCYRIGFLDVCGNQSRLSDSICPVWLRVDMPDDFEKQVIWTPMDGWKDGLLRYILLRFSDGDATTSSDMKQATSVTYNRRDSVGQIICYQIQSYANNTADYPGYSLSNKVCIEQKSKLLFPDVFTPNDDRSNDDFRCYNLFIKSFEMKIFNAWGEMIYYSTDPKKGWNGKIEGKPAMPGGYAYWAQGEDERGHLLKSKGYFSLVR